MIEINMDNVLNLLQQVVDTKGSDYVYLQEKDELGRFWGCAYVHTDDEGKSIPGCIVGQVLIANGVEPDWFLRRNFNRGWDVSSLIPHLLEDEKASITPEACAVLQQAQCTQDGGAPWGIALGDAKGRHQAILEGNASVDY